MLAASPFLNGYSLRCIVQMRDAARLEYNKILRQPEVSQDFDLIFLEKCYRATRNSFTRQEAMAGAARHRLSHARQFPALISRFVTTCHKNSNVTDKGRVADKRGLVGISRVAATYAFTVPTRQYYT